MNDALARALDRSKIIPRVAVVDDIPAAVSLRCLMLAEELGRAITIDEVRDAFTEYEKLISTPNAVVFIVNADDLPVGTVACKLVGDIVDAGNLFVDPRYRDHTIGISLVKAVIDVSETWKAKSLRLQATPGKIKFYDRHFQVQSIIYTLEVSHEK